MGGSASKKENFPDISLTQEQIDVVYSNFSEFSKLKDGKSGSFIGEKGLAKVFLPNKQIGKKLHAFLAHQAISQTLDFDTFLGFVEFFLFDNEYSRKDVRYRDYSVLELFGLISFQSAFTKNKHTDKDYINRLSITFRAALDFVQELHGLVASCGQKKETQRDEIVPKKITTAIFEELYELPFGKFIEKVYDLVPNAEKLIRSYFKRLLFDTDHKLENEKTKKEGEETHSTYKEQKAAFSGLFNHNNLSKLTFTLPDFPDLLYREKIYDGDNERFNYTKLAKAFEDGKKYNLLFLLSHQVEKKAQPGNNDQEANPLQQSIQLSKSLNNGSNQIQTDVLGLYLPKIKGQNMSFFQLSPDLHVYSSNQKQNFFNIDQSAAVVFFGEGEEDIFFLHNDITKESYVKSTLPGFSENGSEPQILKISSIEVWVLSDDPIIWSSSKTEQSQPAPTQQQQQQQQQQKASPQDKPTTTPATAPASSSTTTTTAEYSTSIKSTPQYATPLYGQNSSTQYVLSTPQYSSSTSQQYYSSNPQYISSSPQYTPYSSSLTAQQQQPQQQQYYVVESKTNNQVSSRV